MGRAIVTDYAKSSEAIVSEQIAASIHELWLLARNMTNQSKRRKLTIEQYWILRSIYTKHPLRIKDIAAEIGTTSSPVTISVKRLEHSGLVKRERGKSDEREVRVRLTPQGKKAFEAWRQERRRALSSLFNSLNDGEKNSLRDLLQRTLARIKGPLAL